MPPFDRNASAKSMPSEKLAARRPPHLPYSAKSRWPLQILGLDAALPISQTPPCSLASPGAPVHGRRRAVARPPTGSIEERVPSKPCRLFLGREPYLFGYAYFIPLSTW